MQAFEYANPSTKEEAVKLLNGDAAVLAGGTDLISLMKDLVAKPKRVVNIKSIRELQGISSSAQGLRIGATATLAELLKDATVKKDYPSLWQAAEGVRSPQIQSMGTVAGDLCQRPRCWYYRAGFGLLAMQNGKSIVVNGDNRYHAILGNSGPAYFVNPSSLAPALIALGAKLKVFGPKGAREIPLEQFFVTPKSESEKEYTLTAGEIITEILVPPAAAGRNATYEVRQKEALDWPLAAAAASLEMNGSKVKSARIVLGHVAPIPWRSQAAEKALAGKTVDATLAAQAGEAAVQGAKALSMNGYKIQLTKVAVKRAVLRAAGMEA